MSTLYHLATAGVFAAGVWTDLYGLVLPKESWVEFSYNQFGGQLKFLTFINLNLQAFFFFIAFLNDCCGSDTNIISKRRTLQRFCDWIFTSVVFPVGWFVSVTFWLIYIVDRELIFPAALDAWFPKWLNHVMHTLPLFATSLEILSTSHYYQSGKTRVLPIFALSVVYLSWIHYIYLESGQWVYPFIAVIPSPYRELSFVFLFFTLIGFYLLGEKLSSIMWGKNKKE